MNKNKRIITILSIFTIIFTVMGGSLAYWTWTSNVNTGVAFTIEKEFSCSAAGGENINSTNIQLQPTSDCTNSNYALQKTIKVNPTINRDNLTISLDMWLTVNTLGTTLSESKNLMYAITTNSNSCTTDVVTKGNFKGLTTGNKVNLLSGKEYTGRNLPQDTYYLYIWLDAKETNNNTQNQTFNFSLGGECTDSKEKPLNDMIIQLTNVENSGVYKEVSTGNAYGDYKVIPSNQNSWNNFTQIGEATLTAQNVETGVWETQVTCISKDLESAPNVCEEYNQKTIRINPQETGYYEFQHYNIDQQTIKMPVSVYIDGELIYETICADKCDPRFVSADTVLNDGYEGGATSLGLLTPSNTIEIVIGGKTKGHPTFTGEATEFFRLLKQEEIVRTVETYRYEGRNVNNYLSFNNETWRIIGVEEGSDIGLQKGKYYTKIIRDTSAGMISYVSVNVGDKWGSSGLGIMKDMLDYGYFNQVSADKWEKFDYANFEENGLNELSRTFVATAGYRGGTYSNPMKNTIDTYFDEMIKKTVLGYVGLMSPSDYGFAALQSQCKNTSLSFYQSCNEYNWLYSGTDELLISDAGEIFIEEEKSEVGVLVINATGNVEISLPSIEKNYRPVVYLKSATTISTGTGEIDRLYIISLPESEQYIEK